MEQFVLIKNRKLNGLILSLIALTIFLIVLLFRVPKLNEYRNLRNLGYDSEAISAIRDKKLSKIIIKNAYYNEYLNAEVKKENFHADYIDLYNLRNKVDDKLIFLYEKLQKKGYTLDEAKILVKELRDFEIIALLTFDKQEQIDDFINDVKKHPENSETSFVLNGNYIKYFESLNTNVFSNLILVNKNNAIDPNADLNLVDMSVKYASDGQRLNNEAYNAFKLMVDTMANTAEKLSIYASQGYRSISEQQNLYSEYRNPDKSGISRPGQSEFNTGLTISLIANGYESFSISPEAKWLNENAHKFGFILRYPKGKEIFTGSEYVSNIYRYVGIEAASKIYEEKLSFEEYHALYLN